MSRSVGIPVTVRRAGGGSRWSKRAACDGAGSRWPRKASWSGRCWRRGSYGRPAAPTGILVSGDLAVGTGVSAGPSGQHVVEVAVPHAPDERVDLRLGVD